MLSESTFDSYDKKHHHNKRFAEQYAGRRRQQPLPPQQQHLPPHPQQQQQQQQHLKQLQNAPAQINRQRPPPQQARPSHPELSPSPPRSQRRVLAPQQWQQQLQQPQQQHPQQMSRTKHQQPPPPQSTTHKAPPPPPRMVAPNRGQRTPERSTQPSNLHLTSPGSLPFLDDYEDDYRPAAAPPNQQQANSKPIGNFGSATPVNSNNAGASRSTTPSSKDPSPANSGDPGNQLYSELKSYQL
jgi:hypothetical protein